MAKYYGKIGFGHTVEDPDGVHEFVVTERDYKGDVIRPSVKASQGDQIIPGLTTGNSISIIEDGYLSENFFAIIYATWMGVKWTVKKIDSTHPRLVLALGEVYNGPTPGSP